MAIARAHLMLAGLLALVSACGGNDEPPSLLFFDLIYLDDCGCPFEDVDLTAGATAGALVEEAATFDELSFTCETLPARATNTLLSIEPLLPEAQDVIFEGVDFISVLVTVYTPPIAGQGCIDFVDDANLFGQAIDVRLTGADQIIEVEMSCLGRDLPCF